jgi:hypothetical protein
VLANLTWRDLELFDDGVDHVHKLNCYIEAAIAISKPICACQWTAHHQSLTVSHQVRGCNSVVASLMLLRCQLELCDDRRAGWL